VSVARGAVDRPIARRTALGGALLVALGAGAAALGGGLGGRREARAQSKPAIAVHKSPT
jgi:hypothetical protein